MEIIFIADSLEINGGCIMFLETLSAFKRYTQHNVQGYVVSKTGQYGRNNLVSELLPKSYLGEVIKSIRYEEISSIDFKNKIVVHHRNAHTKPIITGSPYFVINHTVDEISRIKDFQSATIISVCEYIKVISKRYVDSIVVLNGIENKDIAEIEPSKLDAGFRTGRCHRLVGNKFHKESLQFLKSIKLKDHRHFIIGPIENSNNVMPETTDVKHFGPIFDRAKKLSILKSLDVYFYDTYVKEGASVAILESLACGVPVIAKPLGGNVELIKSGVNGFLVKDYKEAREKLELLHKDRPYLDRLKQSTLEDFNSRLHISNMVSKYNREFQNA